MADATKQHLLRKKTSYPLNKKRKLKLHLLFFFTHSNTRQITHIDTLGSEKRVRPTKRKRLLSASFLSSARSTRRRFFVSSLTRGPNDAITTQLEGACTGMNQQNLIIPVWLVESHPIVNSERFLQPLKSHGKSPYPLIKTICGCINASSGVEATTLIDAQQMEWRPTIFL